MAIYYASSLATGGGNGSLGNPWTLQEGADGTLASDELRIMADGIYYPTAGVVSTVTASIDFRPMFVGANASGVVDGTFAVIDGSNLPANTDIFTYNTALQYADFKLLQVQNSPRHGIYHLQSGSIEAQKCKFIDNAGSGFFVGSSASSDAVLFCLLKGNLNGFGAPNVSRAQRSFIIGSKFEKNSGIAIQVSAHSVILSCSLIRNGIGIGNNDGLWNRTFVSGCAFLANASHDIDARTVGANGILIKNSIFRLSGGYAINTKAGNKNSITLYNDCFSSATSGAVDINGGIPWGEGHVLADPMFESEVDGIEDLRLKTGSPCRNAGIGVCC